MQRKIYTLIFALISWFGIEDAICQTNPVAQSLPYSQNFAGLVAASTTYPAGWQGWNLSTTGPTTTFRTIAPPASSDLAITANANASTATGGIMNYTGKIGFLPTATIEPTICLAINTTGFNTVQVTFDVMTVRNPFDGVNTRVNQVDLQYRVGTSGVFTSVSNLTNGIYQNNTTNQTTAITTPQNLVAKAFVLPSACNNQAVVQLRWVVRDFTGTGNRPGFAIDNVIICSTPVTPTISISGPTAFCNGTTATYTATQTNGGSPVYQWKRNGANVGTNASSITLAGLNPGDQISCVMTSSLNCVTSLNTTSNILTIVTVLSSPTITSASISDVTCPGAHNGAVTISVAGGTPPYTIAWDTINTLNGPVFGVTVATKSAQHPFFNLGNPLAFQIDGVEAKTLNLVRGLPYTFNVLTPAHPFHISTDSLGGNINNIVSAGQTGAPTQSGTVTFTPGPSTPSMLYYPCQFHTYMGYRVAVNNGYVTSGTTLTGAHAGKYSVVVTDANGCTATAQYTISELPSPVTLNATITNSACFGATGSIDLSVTGGAAPYTICWDTLNTSGGNQFGVMVGTKTASNPFFGLGSLLAFYIDGTEAKTLKLVKEIPYSFNILSPTHPFHISTDPIGGSTAGMVSSGQSGAPSDNGTVVFTPTNSSPSTIYYDCSNHQYMGAPVSIVDGYCTEDLSGLHSGKYSVIVRDANGCEANATFTVNEEGEPATIDAIQNLFCYGATDGSVSISTSGSNPPYTLSGSGPVFSVIVEVKNHSHPQYGQGSRPDGFTIDGVQGRELTLVRGITYAFSVFAPSHEFFISTSDVGGPLNTASVVTDGVTNNFVAVGTLFFTPNALHPNLLYYQCGIHDYMGWKLNIVDGISDLNVNNLVAGDYSLVATDASGCPSPPITFTIQQPAPTIFYYDGDSDGFGIETESTLACSAPLGFSDVAGDCDDFDSGITGIISYSDVDGDGFGDPLTRIGTCTLPVGNVLDGSDCNDQDAAINPGASEVCNGIDDNCDGLVDNGIVCQLTVNVKIMIQGYFDGVNLMRAVSDPLAFPGTSDTITVQLASSLPPYDIMYASQSAVSLSGIGAFTFPPEVSGGDFYIVIKHRSSLEIWSAIPYTISDNFTFDCQTDPAQVLGSNLAALGNGLYGMWSGDVNQDGLIDENDLVSVETDLPLFSQGYLSQDLDGNQIIESADYSLIENNSAFGLSVIHP